MAGVVPDEGEVHMLAVMLGSVAAESLTLRLFVNDKIPGLTDVASDYTEMSTNGYARKTLDPSAWAFTPASPGTNTPGKAQAGMQSFTFTAAGAPVNVYGYLLVGVTSLRLWAAERFVDGPYRVQNAGDVIDVTPVLRLRSEYPA